MIFLHQTANSCLLAVYPALRIILFVPVSICKVSCPVLRYHVQYFSFFLGSNWFKFYFLFSLQISYPYYKQVKYLPFQNKEMLVFISSLIQMLPKLSQNVIQTLTMGSRLIVQVFQVIYLLNAFRFQSLYKVLVFSHKAIKYDLLFDWFIFIGELTFSNSVDNVLSIVNSSSEFPLKSLTPYYL